MHDDPGYNPYAAPEADLTREDTGQQPIWCMNGNTLVIRKGAVLPPQVCLKTNRQLERSEAQLASKNLHWYPQWILLIFILVSAPLGILLALILRKSMRVQLPLSPEAVSNSWRHFWIGWAIFLVPALGVFGVLAASQAAEDALILGPLLVGFLTGLIGLVYASYMATYLRPAKITKEYGWFYGADREFLDRFPRWENGWKEPA